MSASWQRVLGLMIVASWLVVGCSGGKKVDVGSSCVLNSDCNQGLVCTWGKCHVACNTSADCPAGQSCVTSSDQSNVCQLPGETYCIYNHDCPTGLICGVDQQCRKQCQVDVDCPYGQICTSAQTCVDPNNNRVVPDAGLGGFGGAPDAGGAGGSADAGVPDVPGAQPDVPIGGTDGAGAGGTDGASSGTSSDCPEGVSVMCGMVAAHNSVRAAAPSASPALPPMTWDATLAAFAQAYASTCPTGHNPNPTVEGQTAGENMFFTSQGSFSPPAEVVQAWASEQANYAYPANTCGGVPYTSATFSCSACPECGHYTQIVWRTTITVGCGVASGCSGSFPQVWVCDYLPAGNVIDLSGNVELPY